MHLKSKDVVIFYAQGEKQFCAQMQKKKEKKKLPILHSLNLIAIFFWGAALLNCRIILPQRRHTDDLLKVF